MQRKSKEPCLAFRGWRVLAAGLILLSIPFSGISASLDRVLIVVNDEAITESEYNARYRQELLELEGRGLSGRETQIREQLTEKIIIDRLLMQRAEAAGISVEEAEVEAAISALADRNGVSTSRMFEMLAEDGVEEKDFRDGIRERLTTRRLVDLRINTAIQIPDEEIEEFMKNRPELQQGDLSYEFSRILIEVPDGTDEAEQEALFQKAQRLQIKIESGETTFAAAARANSDGEGAVEGGYQGWRRADQLPDLYLEALRGMGSGQLSGVLKGGNGYHILQLRALRGSGDTVEQYHVRHILLRPTDILPEDEVLKRLRQLRERIVVNGEPFEELAILYSEDSLSRSKGGDLDWIGPGDVAPEFEQMLAELEDGEISQPLKTRYGYHLIQMLGRRQQDAFADLARDRSRQAIHSRKAEELYQAWLTELRDRSYVEFVEKP